MTTSGRTPARGSLIPYGRQFLDEDDIAAVVEVLRSDWLTTGPAVDQFESAFAARVGAAEAVAVSSGTAALHAAVHAIGVGPGDEVVVPAMTFAATANCVLFEGGMPIFADVDPETLLIGPEQVEERLSERTRAVIAVDYAGQPCEYDALERLCSSRGIILLADACHALGAAYRGRSVGSLALLNAFSFHPVKPITTGEGGMVTTDDPELARRTRVFRNHGITTDHRQRTELGSWFYEMVELGHNYRLSDIQCALGTSQLRKLDRWVERRREIAARYDRALRDVVGVCPLRVRDDVVHAYHLYVVRVGGDRKGATRAEVFASLRRQGVGCNVHYVPVHLHPFYREKFDLAPGLCPVAEAAYEEILTLPLFSAMSDDEVDTVVAALRASLDGQSGA